MISMNARNASIPATKAEETLLKEFIKLKDRYQIIKYTRTKKIEEKMLGVLLLMLLI
jgi:hypothetical protein